MKGLKICVLLPDYSTTTVDYQYYDPPRDLSKLLPECSFTTVFLNKLTTYRQLKDLSKQHFDIYINLCEGYLEWEVPSVEVPYFLELLGLPFTGPTSLLYDPEKTLMKYVAFTQDVLSPAHTLLKTTDELEKQVASLNYPMFVKPAKAGDSLGISAASKVSNSSALRYQAEEILKEFDEALVEEYISGREFTVLVLADPEDSAKVISFTPVEYIFPEGFDFKTYELKTSSLHPDSNIKLEDKELSQRIRTAAEKIFRGFNGSGYARMDFRMDAKGNLFFLEVNFTCSVFYENAYEGSADHILNNDPIGKSGFLELIIKEGLSRYRRKKKCYDMKGNAISGYGIYANRDIRKDEIIFKGEERSQRIVTLDYVKRNWNEDQQRDFRHYAYPIGNDVYILWSDNARDWAPQNHSCSPNTAYAGLNVIALCDIPKGEELTLDYAELLDHTAAVFNCNCNSTACRGEIKGRKIAVD
jgi:D-alanine-D-alanine ligase